MSSIMTESFKNFERQSSNAKSITNALMESGSRIKNQLEKSIYIQAEFVSLMTDFAVASL